MCKEARPKLRRPMYLSVRMKPPSFMTGTFLTMLRSPNSLLYCCPEKNTESMHTLQHVKKTGLDCTTP